MKKAKQAITALISAVFMLFAASCELSPVDAKKLSEVYGTYRLTSYYSVRSEERWELLDKFDFFYIIFAENTAYRVIYRVKGDTAGVGYTAKEYTYSCKYATANAEYVKEIKLRFPMPFSDKTSTDALTENSSEVTYLTVTNEDSLVCQKISYLSPVGDEKYPTRDVLHISFKQVSADTDYKYVEKAHGIKVEKNNVDSPYLPSSK